MGDRLLECRHWAGADQTPCIGKWKMYRHSTRQAELEDFYLPFFSPQPRDGRFLSRPPKWTPEFSEIRTFQFSVDNKNLSPLGSGLKCDSFPRRNTLLIEHFYCKSIKHDCLIDTRSFQMLKSRPLIVCVLLFQRDKFRFCGSPNSLL